jgi:hypothetical protein
MSTVKLLVVGVVIIAMVVVGAIAQGGTEPAQSDGHPGVAGNERLTALAGAVLLVLAAVEVITVPTLRSLLSVHFFVGVLLVGPLAVKTGSTGWRFVRYYTRSPAYRRKGPPRLLLRVLAPLLLASTLALIGSGIALAATGPAPPLLLIMHKISFLVWLVTLVVHVIAYLRPVPRLIADDWRQRRTPPAPGHTPALPAPVPGRRARLAVNVAALVAGASAALFLLPTTAAWIPWLAQGGR